MKITDPEAGHLQVRRLPAQRLHVLRTADLMKPLPSGSAGTAVAPIPLAIDLEDKVDRKTILMIRHPRLGFGDDVAGSRAALGVEIGLAMGRPERLEDLKRMAFAVELTLDRLHALANSGVQKREINRSSVFTSHEAPPTLRPVDKALQARARATVV
ncbi:MAG: hypothetical protein E6575_04220 [Bradyrhizobium sp.]|nr:hypothetical protein [Bradyrhizobium sp.]MDU6731268.1 hypothetical protein [Bradyrhizobium sp.]